MSAIEVCDLLDLTAYEKARPEILDKTIAYKRTRRVTVGKVLTFIFENRETVLFQIQEMMRTERIVAPDRIQGEIDAYSDLLPGKDQLSATLMIEIVDRANIRAMLDRLVGIDEFVFMDVGNESLQASFDPKQFEADRISAVQYLKFSLGPLSSEFRDPSVPVKLRVEHQNLRAETTLDGAIRDSLAADLGGS